MKSIKDISLSGKRVLVRVDFNVPLDEFQNITDDSRIRGVLQTLKYALDHNAKLIVASHMGRPKGKVVPELSLAHVAKRLGRLLEKDVKMAEDSVGPEVESPVSVMKDGDVLLLENLRFHAEEEKNDDAFSKALAGLCDVYINDAFAVSHRVNASVVAVAKYSPVSGAGFLLQKELDYFKKALAEPQRPLVAVVGGSKVSSKPIRAWYCFVTRRFARRPTCLICRSTSFLIPTTMAPSQPTVMSSGGATARSPRYTRRANWALPSSTAAPSIRRLI